MVRRAPVKIHPSAPAHQPQPFGRFDSPQPAGNPSRWIVLNSSLARSRGPLVAAVVALVLPFLVGQLTQLYASLPHW